MGLSNTWDAFTFDSATATFCTTVENEMNKVEGKNEKANAKKRDAILRRYIPELTKAQKFRDPGKG